MVLFKVIEVLNVIMRASINMAGGQLMVSFFCTFVTSIGMLGVGKMHIR